MPELKTAVFLPSLRQPFKKALATAARLGAAAVEIDARGEIRPGELSNTGLRQLRKLLEDLNLRVAAVRFMTRRGYNVPADLDRRVEATKAAMQFGRSLGASVLVNHVGRVPPPPAEGESPGNDWNLLVDVLGELGGFGQHVGAALAAKTGSESSTDLGRLLNALPEGTLAVALDPANLLINGHAPLEAAEQLGAHVVHVHARDGVHDLAQGRGVEVPLGRGAVDFPALVATLEQYDYHGYFSLERSAGEDPVYELGQGVKYLRNL